MRAGKIRHYGVSVEKVEEAMKALEFTNVQTVQIIFNCFRQKPAEALFARARLKQVGILARVPLASGLLTGKLRRDSTFAPDDHRNFNRQGGVLRPGRDLFRTWTMRSACKRWMKSASSCPPASP